MLALLLIATAPDVVEHCAAQARRHARVSAGALAEACTASVLDGQMLASCQRVLADGRRVASLMTRDPRRDRAAAADEVEDHLKACRAGVPQGSA